MRCFYNIMTWQKDRNLPNDVDVSRPRDSLKSCHLECANENHPHENDRVDPRRKVTSKSYP